MGKMGDYLHGYKKDFESDTYPDKEETMKQKVKITKFNYKGNKIRFSHHNHPVLGRYTALSINKKMFITGLAGMKDIKNAIDTGKLKG
jgi:hypothetical protein